MSIEVSIKKKLHDFTLAVSFSAENEHLGLLGASGCGKSMTLKCIAGIEKPDSGYIRINGTTVYDSEKGINFKPGKRKCGFLFQNYALFPSMTIAQNIELVLDRLPPVKRRQKAAEILKQFGIENLAGRNCTELSGGQQQRAALARIMVNEPEIIMLDEPFSALDSFVKQKVETNLITMISGFRGTVLFVSHNRDEIYRICDSITVISNGCVCRTGACRDVFTDPRTVAAAHLTGCRNIAACERRGERSLYVKDWNMELSTIKKITGEHGYIGIRAHYIREPLSSDTVNCYRFNVKRQRNSPFSISEYLSLPGASVPVEREISVDSGTVNLADTVITGSFSEKLCIPPEAIMLLSE